MAYGTQKIRVVKRKAAAAAVDENNPKRIPEPDIVANVSRWVDEVRDRKSRERKTAIEKFYSTNSTLRQVAAKAAAR
jgi:hypothetical protein